MRIKVAMLIAALGVAPIVGICEAAAQQRQQFRQVDPAMNTKDMDPATILAWDCDKRMEWARLRIGDHIDALMRSAANNNVPPELLAVVILNELADYSIIDIGQERIPSTGSVGIAQINVNRAIRYDLLRGIVTDADVRNLARLGAIPILRAEGTTDEQAARQFLTWSRLNEPETALEAAAREVDRILDEMSADPDGPWARFFVSGPLARDDIYANVKPSHIAAERTISGARLQRLIQSMDAEALRLRRESALAIGVTAAYNTETILTVPYDHTRIWDQPPDGHPFLNARRHALNADQIWVNCFQGPSAEGFLPRAQRACTNWSVETTLTFPSSTPGGQPSTHRLTGTWVFDPSSGQFRASMADLEVRDWRYTFSLPAGELSPGRTFSFRSIESDGSFRDSLGSYEGRVDGPGVMSGTFQYQGGRCCGSERVLGTWKAVCTDRR